MAVMAVNVVRSPLVDLAVFYGSGSVRILADRKNEVLTLTLQEQTSAQSNPPGAWTDQGTQVFAPSKVVPGDYDRILDTTFENRRRTFQATAADIAYLHRLDDSRLIEYHALARDTPSTAKASIAPRLLDMAHVLVAAHPADLHIRTVYRDALLRNGRLDELKADTRVCRSAIFASPHRWLRVVLAMVEDELDSVRSSRAGTNAADITNLFLNRSTDLDKFLKIFPTILVQQNHVRGQGELIYAPESHFLELQTLAKVIRVTSVMALLQGRHEDSWNQLRASYRMGQLLNARNDLLEGLIGVACRAISTAGLEVFAMNAEVSPAELARVHQELTALERSPPATSGFSFHQALGIPLAPEAALDYETRELLAHTRFRLLLCSIAARHRLLEKKQLPMSVSDFAPLFPNGLPADPFTSEPLRLLPAYNSPLVVYSVGPDRKSQRASIVYDTTNGTISPGDIVIEIPRKPKYPFTRKPLRSWSREAVLDRFRQGLPLDPFATYKGWGLNITGMSPTQVYSFGPDTDQESIMLDYKVENAYFGPDPPRILTRYSDSFNPRVVESYVPKVQYDPTNGLLSAGDIFITLRD